MIMDDDREEFNETFKSAMSGDDPAFPMPEQRRPTLNIYEHGKKRPEKPRAAVQPSNPAKKALKTQAELQREAIEIFNTGKAPIPDDDDFDEMDKRVYDRRGVHVKI